MAFQTWVSTKRGIWITWILVTTIAWGFDVWGFTGIVGGALLGALQWLVLRRVIVKAWWWIVATAIATAIASLSTVVLLMAVGDPSPPAGVFANVVAFVVVVLAPGAIVGAAQYAVLKGKLPNAGWWIGATAGGMALYQAALLQGREWLSNSPYVCLLVLGLAAVASAILTGGALVWLLQKRGQWSEPKDEIVVRK